MLFVNGQMAEIDGEASVAVARLIADQRMISVCTKSQYHIR